MPNGKLVIVVGGQFGSEAKGHVTAQLAARYDADLVIRTGGPNAGHTVYGPPPVEKMGNGDGLVHERQQFKLRQLPTAAVSNPRSTIAIAAGALLDEQLLREEMRSTGRERIVIDPAVTLLTEEHRRSEERDPDMQWGSTKEGIGAARADRIHRTARTVGQEYGVSTEFEDAEGGGYELAVLDVATVARDSLAYGGTVLIEAAQGYGLGLHTQYYPKTTSADCRAIDALADVGLSPWCDEIRYATLEIWVVVRPFPIRVAGESGPLFGETSWEDLELPTERTTVTNKVRRVGIWDHRLVRDAVLANGGGRRMQFGDGAPVKIALTMVDQVVPELQGLNSVADTRLQDPALVAKLWRWMQRADACGAPVGMLTTSPYDAVFDVDSPAFQRFAAGQFAVAGD